MSVEGIDLFLDSLRRFEAEVDAIDPRGGAEIVVEAARVHAPVATGALARSGRVEGTTENGFAVFGGGDIAHAGPQNSGALVRPQGGYNPATRFIDRGRNESEEAVSQYWDAAIDRLVTELF